MFEESVVTGGHLTRSGTKRDQFLPFRLNRGVMIEFGSYGLLALALVVVGAALGRVR